MIEKIKIEYVTQHSKNGLVRKLQFTLMFE